MKTATAPALVQLIDCLRETGGLKNTDIANFAGVSLATLSRWETAGEMPSPKTQLLVSDLAFVVTPLGQYYGPDEVRAWLYARHPQLDGERAIEWIRAGRSEEVVAILDRLDADACL